MTNQKIVQIISSFEIRAEFERWLGFEHQAGTRLVVLEGLRLQGKSRLIAEPCILGVSRSANIEMDDFLGSNVPETTPYDMAIDRSQMKTWIETQLASAPLVVIEGAIAWPLIRSIATSVGLDRVRRAYLKRMRRLNPDIWVDESVLFDRGRWPPNEFFRSIYRYHAEQRPWRDCDLVLKRIETEEE